MFTTRLKKKQKKKTYLSYINVTLPIQVAIRINLFWHVKNNLFHHTSNLAEEKFTATKIHVELSKLLYEKM